MLRWLSGIKSSNNAGQCLQTVDAEDQAASQLINAVYYPNYTIYRQQAPSSLNLRYASHIFYAFAWPKADGTIALSDDYADTKMQVGGVQGCLRAFGDLKGQYPSLKLVLSVGGGGQGSKNFAAVADSMTIRRAFAGQAKRLVDTYGLDGIDIDWEHPQNAREGANYVSLLASLRNVLPRPRYVLSSALPGGEWALRDISLHAASVHLDFVNLMCYDFCGPWTNTCGHHAQLYTPRCPANNDVAPSCASAVAYVRSKGVHAHKIVLGIPVYGRSFLGASTVGMHYSGSTGEEGVFEYRDLPRNGAQEGVDNEVGAAYCVGGDGGFVTYDNPQTVTMKADFVRREGLGGLFYWAGTGDKAGDGSLVKTGHVALHRR